MNEEAELIVENWLERLQELAYSIEDNWIYKVKYTGERDTVAFERDKVYRVVSIEKGWYRVVNELEETYLFPPDLFEIVESNGKK